MDLDSNCSVTWAHLGGRSDWRPAITLSLEAIASGLEALLDAEAAGDSHRGFRMTRHGACRSSGTLATSVLGLGGVFLFFVRSNSQAGRTHLESGIKQVFRPGWW